MSRFFLLWDISLKLAPAASPCVFHGTVAKAILDQTKRNNVIQFDQTAMTSVSMLISLAEDILHKSRLLQGLVWWLGEAWSSLILPE